MGTTMKLRESVAIALKNAMLGDDDAPDAVHMAEAAIAAVRAHDAAGADWEAVAGELERRGDACLYSRRTAYQDAAALIRERRPVARVEREAPAEIPGKVARIDAREGWAVFSSCNTDSLSPRETFEAFVTDEAVAREMLKAYTGDDGEELFVFDGTYVPAVCVGGYIYAAESYDIKSPADVGALLGTPAAQPAIEPAQTFEPAHSVRASDFGVRADGTDQTAAVQAAINATAEIAQSFEPGVSDAVSHAVAGAYDQGYRACRSAHGYSRACCVYAGLRAALAAAQVVPRSELEAMQEGQRMPQGTGLVFCPLDRPQFGVDDHGAWMGGDGMRCPPRVVFEEAHAELRREVQRGRDAKREHEKALAAATARAEAAEAKLTALATRETAERLVYAYYRHDDPKSVVCLVPQMHNALRTVLDQPAPRAERDVGAELDALVGALRAYCADPWVRAGDGDRLRRYLDDALSAGKAVPHG